MLHKLVLTAAVLFASLAGLATASASCNIHNDTGYDWKIESGNVSNQSVGAHTTTTIHEGRIVAKDDKTGKSVSGSCKSGDSVEIKDDHGVPVLEVKSK